VQEQNFTLKINTPSPFKFPSKKFHSRTVKQGSGRRVMKPLLNAGLQELMLCLQQFTLIFPIRRKEMLEFGRLQTGDLII
jgi:hypothetical protein